MLRPPASAAFLRQVALSAWFVALGAVNLSHPSATRIYTWPWAVVTVFVWLLPVGTLLVTWASAETWRLPNRVITTGLLLLVGAALLSASLSPFSPAPWVRVWPTLSGTALFLWLHHSLSEPARAFAASRRMLVVASVSIAAAIFSLVSLAGWISRAPPFSGVRNDFPFGHSNYVAGILVLLLPWLVLRAIRARHLSRFAWSIVAIAGCGALAGTSSRGGVVAGMVMIALVLVAMLRSPSWSSAQKGIAVSVALFVGLFIVVANPRLRDLALGGGWSEVARESNEQRRAMLQGGMRLGGERPLVGWGPGAVPLAYPRIRATLDGGVDNILQLHNTPVQVWATLGGLGIGALLLLGYGSGVAFIRATKPSADHATTLTAACSLFGYSIFALTDHQLDLPGFTMLLAALLALVTSAARDSVARQWARSSRWAVIASTVLGMSVLLATTTTDLRARRSYDRALDALEQKHDDEFITLLGEATALTPYDPFFEHHVAARLLEAAGATRDLTLQRSKRIAARERLERSLQTGVHEEFAHFNLGWLLLDLDEPAAAAAHFIAAAQQAPNKGGVYFGLGLARQRVGNEPGAVRAFALEWINDPQQLTSPAWEIPRLAALRPAVRAETLRLYGELRRIEPRAAKAEAWTRWWLAERIPSSELGKGFSRTAAEFVAALPAMIPGALDAKSGGSAGSGDGSPWKLCFAAWQRGDFTAISGGEAPFASALQRRRARHPDDFQAFLTAPSEDEAALVRLFRRQRLGYGVLAYHPEGPALNDLYIVQENRVAADFGIGLFPPKGWIPGRFLLAWLTSEK